jgi:ureidoacrylate peracid hydrolase
MMRTINGVTVRDSLGELVDPKVTALVVIDVQNDFCSDDGHFARHGKDLSSIKAIVPGVVGFVSRAQALGVRTFFVQQTTLSNGRSDSPAWLRFKCRDGKSPDYTLRGSWGWRLVDGLTVGPNDWEIEKFRPDVFVGTPMDGLLRANGIESVVMLGTITEGCVESSVRGASYHDYYVVVVRDLVASPNRVQHEGAMRLFETRYPLASSDEILAIWERSSAERPRVQAAE